MTSRKIEDELGALLLALGYERDWSSDPVDWTQEIARIVAYLEAHPESTRTILDLIGLNEEAS